MRTAVIGGGIVGIAIAHRLAEAGADVVLIESGETGAGASHGNAAKIALAESAPVPAPGVLLQGLKWMLKPDSPLSVRPSLNPSYLRFMLGMARHCNAASFQHGLEVHLRLAEKANELLDSYVTDGLQYEMHSRGVLLAFETRERYEEQSAQLETFERFGIVPEHLEGDAVLDREPALSDHITHGLFFPGDRQLQPDSLSKALVERCREMGVEVRTHTAVSGFRRRGNRVTGVLTSQGEVVDAESVVLAAGAWSRPLARNLGVDLPIHPGKGYSVDYSPEPVTLRTSLTLEDARVAITPLDGMVRLAGTMEFGTMDTLINGVRVEAIRQAAHRGLRGWAEAEPERAERTPWAGLRPMTPDGLPVIGQLGDLDNAYVASGHGMLGLTLAPGTAEIVAGQVLGKTPDMSPSVLEAVSPRRFGSRRIRRRSAALSAA